MKYKLTKNKKTQEKCTQSISFFPPKRRFCQLNSLLYNYSVGKKEKKHPHISISAGANAEQTQTVCTKDTQAYYDTTH